MLQVTLSQDHGYAGFVAIFSALFLVGLGGQVGAYRRSAKVPYPNQYATHQEAKDDHAKLLFNCAQRAHLNTLEYYPTFLVLYVLSCIEYPRYAALAGLVFLAGRTVYALGYCTGIPANRNRGAFGYLGLLALLAMATKTCFDLV